MDVDELQRQVEYKYAPGPLLAVQALANTYSVEDDEERLLNPQAVRDWLVETGLALPSIEVDADDLERLRGFRQLIWGLLRSHREADAEPDLAELARLAQTHPAPLTVTPAGELALDLDPVESIDALVAQVLGIIFEAQAQGKFDRLKICASDECCWAFYDTSKNHSGTWCRMEECGNRVKNRRYRARRTASLSAVGATATDASAAAAGPAPRSAGGC